MLEHWSRIFFLVQRFLFAVSPVAYNTLFVISAASFEAHVLHSLRVCLRFVICACQFVRQDQLALSLSERAWRH